MRHLKIDIACVGFPPEPTGEANQNHDLAESLARAGADVTVFTAMPFQPGWHKLPAYRRRLSATEQGDGCTIKRSYVAVPREPHGLRFFLHELSFANSFFWRRLFSKRPDAMLVVSPPLSLGFAARVYCWLFRVPFFLYIHELQPETYLDTGRLKPGGLQRVYRWLKRSALKGAARIGCNSMGLRHRLVGQGVAESKIHVLRNWVDLEFFKARPRRSDFAKEFGLADKFVVMSHGSIGPKQDAGTILAAAGKLAHRRDIIFVLAGEGSDKDGLIEQAEASGLNNVMFLPLLPRQDLPYLLSAADIYVLAQPDVNSIPDMPARLSEALAIGLPAVIAGPATSEASRLAEDRGFGLACPAGDAASLAREIEELLGAPQKRSELAEAARRYAEDELARERVLPALVVVLDDMVR